MGKNFWIQMLACLWFLYETNHYGWNMVAQSDAEMICDGIGFIILAIAFLPNNTKGN